MFAPFLLLTTAATLIALVAFLLAPRIGPTVNAADVQPIARGQAGPANRLPVPAHGEWKNIATAIGAFVVGVAATWFIVASAA